MRTCAVLLALLLALPAQAATIAVARMDDGRILSLTDEVGPCVAGARLATLASADAMERVQGCWSLGRQAVLVAFLSGECVLVPVSVLRRPEEI